MTAVLAIAAGLLAVLYGSWPVLRPDLPAGAAEAETETTPGRADVAGGGASAAEEVALLRDWSVAAGELSGPRGRALSRGAGPRGDDV